ncbi:MAG TPA: alkaline phosphatase [Nocardioides sp.]|nr:alkaline phosphatase [Nocardioides sp.]
MKRLPLVTLAIGTALGLALGVTATLAYDAARDDTVAPAGTDEPTVQDRAPRSVILLIGDGMDDSMITAARSYSVGADGRLALDELPHTGAMTTYGLLPGAGPDYPIAYVSDSAATASAFSTGRKTVDGRISQGPSSAQDVPGEDYETVLELFAEDGRPTGSVTTADVTDATPAAAAAHVNARSCQDPTTMDACPSARKSAGGKGSIAEQLVDNGVDVLLGGGSERWGRTLEDGSQTLLDYAAAAHGYRPIGTADELGAVDGLAEGPVLGLFSPNHLTRTYAPLVAARGGATTADGSCIEQDVGSEPSLQQMTAKALELLDDPDGFFLQVEGASIDKSEHERDVCGAIGELEQLDLAVRTVLDYQRDHPDTLVIVTGDHAHSTQIVADDAGGRRTATVTTADGAPLTVAYSTAEGGDPRRSSHTGTQIRVAAVGPGAERVTGVVDQTDLFALMTCGLE